MSVEDIYKRGAAWLKAMESLKSVLIVYHRDSDGVCASVLLEKILKKLGKKSVTSIACDPSTPAVTFELMQKIIKINPNYLLFVDMAVDQDPNQLIILKQKIGCSTIVIDHHPPSNDLNMIDIAHINPRFADSSCYFPASYVVYKIGEKIFDVSDLSWISMIGVIGDKGIDNCKDLVKASTRANGNFGETQKTLEQTKFGHASEMIMAARAMESVGGDGIETSRSILNNSLGIGKFVASRTLDEWYQITQQGIDEAVENFEKKSELHSGGKIAIYKINTPYKIESIVASKISEKYPRTSIMVCRDAGNKIACSLRNQKTADLSKIVKMSLVGLRQSVGGGHPQAAGVLVDKKEWDAFKSNVIRYSRS